MPTLPSTAKKPDDGQVENLLTRAIEPWTARAAMFTWSREDGNIRP
jgi:hypothetical protein